MDREKDLRRPDAPTDPDDWRPDPDEVARLAYGYYEARNYGHGYHDDDWRRAEEEVRLRRPRNATMDTGEGLEGGSSARTVMGVFHTVDQAQAAYDNLVQEGFAREEISLIANKTVSKEWTGSASPETPDAVRSAKSEVAADAGIGAAIGGVGALLVSLAVPGIGPVLAAGPILAALGGAGLGAAAGGLVGALTERGIPEEEATHYAEGVRRGDVLIAVHAGGERADLASQVMDRSGAVSIDDRVDDWRQRGWTGYNTNAQPLTSDELRREREYYNAANFRPSDKPSRIFSGTKG